MYLCRWHQSCAGANTTSMSCYSTNKWNATNIDCFTATFAGWSNSLDRRRKLPRLLLKNKPRCMLQFFQRCMHVRYCCIASVIVRTNCNQFLRMTPIISCCLIRHHQRPSSRPYLAADLDTGTRTLSFCVHTSACIQEIHIDKAYNLSIANYITCTEAY